MFFNSPACGAPPVVTFSYIDPGKTSCTVASLPAHAHLLTFLKNSFKKDAQWEPQIAVKGVLTSATAHEFGRQVFALTAAVQRRAFSDYRKQPKEAEQW